MHRRGTRRLLLLACSAALAPAAMADTPPPEAPVVWSTPSSARLAPAPGGLAEGICATLLGIGVVLLSTLRESPAPRGDHLRR